MTNKTEMIQLMTDKIESLYSKLMTPSDIEKVGQYEAALSGVKATWK
jgi:hypothetical protein